MTRVASALAESRPRRRVGDPHRLDADTLHRVKGCDLVLLDLGLPDMDGLDVLRTLRRASTVPVIIMTARDSDGAVVLGLRAGADDYLVEPSGKPSCWPHRRCHAPDPARRRDAAPAGPVVAGPVTIDRERREVTLDGLPQALTRTNSRSSSPSRPGRVKLSAVRNSCSRYGVPRCSAVAVAGLLHRAAPGRLAGLPLHTVRGFGFRLDS